MENLGTLSAFVHAAETGSFVAAGRAAGLSASAIGKAITRLETRLGVRLFHRNTRSMVLTEEGRVFLDRCRRIFEEIEAAEMEMTQIAVAPSGRLRVSMPLVGMLLMPVITESPWQHLCLQPGAHDRSPVRLQLGSHLQRTPGAPIDAVALAAFSMAVRAVGRSRVQDLPSRTAARWL